MAEKNSIVPSFKNIEAAILYFNGMYKLPIAEKPSLQAEQEWQNKRLEADFDAFEAFRVRLNDFYGTILPNETREYLDIEKLSKDKTKYSLDLLVEQADLLGDHIIYCMSEMVRFGLPVMEILHIIMQSNFSKLGADGKPIYDESGKVQKGPNYWKPEPKIRSLLQEMRGEDKESHYD